MGEKRCAKSEIECYQSDNTQIGRFLRSARFCPESFLVTLSTEISLVGQLPSALLWASLALTGRLLLITGVENLDIFFLHFCLNIDIISIH